jgi:hypothetical protein
MASSKHFSTLHEGILTRFIITNLHRNVDPSRNDNLAGHLEVSGMHTATGNPAVRIFDGDDVILEDVEED